MRRTQISILIAAAIAMALAFAPPALAKKKKAQDDGLKKVIAIGHVNTGGVGFSSLTPEQLSGLFQRRAKEKLEKTGRYVVIIPKHDEDAKPSKQTAQAEKTPTNAADAMKYAQEMQQQFSRMAAQSQGQYVHDPVAAQALFNFNIQTGQRQVSSGGVFGEIQYWTGAPVRNADFSSNSLNMTLTCTSIDPDDGSILGDYKAKASSTKVARVGGVSYYTMEDTSDPDRAFDRMFKRALDSCIKWIDKQLAGNPWEGQIFKKKGASLYVNAGSNAGLSEGMLFDAYMPTKVSGKGVSVEGGLLKTGTVELTQVGDVFAIAKATSGTAGPGAVLKKASE